MGCCAPTQHKKSQFQPYQPERRPQGGAQDRYREPPQQQEEYKDVVDGLPFDPKADNSLQISVVKERSPTPSIMKKQGIYPSRRTTINFNKLELKRQKTIVVKQPPVPPPDIERVNNMSRKFTEARRKAQIEGKEVELSHHYDSDSDLSVGTKGEEDEELMLKISQKFSYNERKPSHVRHGDESRMSKREENEADDLLDPPGSEMFNHLANKVEEMEMIREVRAPPHESLFTGDVFKDPKFPHNDASIFDTERAADPKLDNLEWKRAREILGDKFKILPEKDEDINPTNIKQGCLGDCYLLSALSALAEWPQRIRSLFVSKEPNEAGVYIVRLYLNGALTEIAVDDYFPCKKGQFAFCRNTDSNTIWPMLIEKAYAKVFGSYQRIESGTLTESLQLLTCSYIDIVNHSETMLSEIWREISTAYKSEHVILANVSAGNEDAQEIVKQLGLVDNHAYTIIGANEIKDKDGQTVRLIKVRNPWGQGEWEGDWSDNSDKWTPELREQLDVKQEDDGIFFIDLVNFAKFFHNTTVAKLNDQWEYSMLQTPMCRGQFRVVHLKLIEACRLQLLFFQPGLRFQTGLLDEEFNFDLLNLAVLKYEPNGDYSWVHINEFQRKINCSCTEGTLEPGDYMIFLEIEKETTKSSDLIVHSWFVLRSQHIPERFVLLHKPQPHFLSKMVKACCLSKGAIQQYDKYPGVVRYFSLSDSLTSFGGFLYQTKDEDMVFQENLKYEICDGIETMPLTIHKNTHIFEGGFEVSLKPEEEEVIVLRQEGVEESKFSYRFSTRAVLGDEELKFRILNGEGGKAYQIEDYTTFEPIKVFVKSYFTIEKGMVLIENKEENMTLEFTFDFKGSENLKIKGVKEEDGLQTNLKSRPGSVVAVVVETIDPWKSMPISYTYSFLIL